MKNIEHIKNCYGCGVCATVCPKKIIAIGLNKDGFYEPNLTAADQCIQCGLCLDVCAYSHDDLALQEKEIHGYAAWSNDADVRRSCSSGGIGFEVGKQLIQRGYKACGVKYNVETQRAEHFVANTVSEFVPSIGSKYLQSYTVDGFKSVKRGEKYLVIGTPCQIDSFRRYIRKRKMEDNFVLLDFFCHSVPSMLAWKKYLQLVEKTTGRPIYVAWRNKLYGWHDSYLLNIDGEKSGQTAPDPHKLTDHIGSYRSSFSQKDIFLRLFIGDFCCNPACQQRCKYKYLSSSADIRIGDFWGRTYRKEEKGVSALVAFTLKGNQVVKSLEDCTLIPHPVEVVTEAQLKKNAGHAYLAPLVRILLRRKRAIPSVCWKLVIYTELVLHVPSRILTKMMSKIKQ